MTSKTKKSPGGLSEDKYVYGTDHPYRGKALVFSIKEFSGELGKSGGLVTRDYTDYDVARIKTPLTQLGFDVEVVMHDPGNPSVRMVTCSTILDKITTVAKKDHTRADCFLCMILSYGYNGQIFASDGVLSVERLQEPFKSQQSTLKGKPKMFILQTCMREPSLAKPDAHGVLTKIGTIPTEADFLFFWSHIPTDKYFMTVGQGIRGSIFIIKLAEHVKEYVRQSDEAGKPKEEFLHLCVRITNSVKQYLEENYRGELEKDGKLLPHITTMLTKELWLGKKEAPIGGF